MPNQTKTAKTQTLYPSDQVWAAAFAAQRINNGYVKSQDGSKSNLALMLELLAQPDLVTDSDREQAQLVRRYFLGMTFQALRGTINWWDRNCWQVAEQSEVNSFALGVVAAIPSTYIKHQQRQTVDNIISSAQGGFVGQVGQRVGPIDVTVLQTQYSQQWLTHFVTAHTSQDQIVRFAQKNHIEPGSRVVIQGRVRAHREGVTQLHYVRIKK